jgi:phage terminase large subunit-like protein
LINMSLVDYLIPKEGQSTQDYYDSMPLEVQREWLPSQSLKTRLALLPEADCEAWLATCDSQTLIEMARGEWWFIARPKQTPPPGKWMIYLALAGRGFGKTKAGSEWIVERALGIPADASGFATEHLVIAETLSDARIVCAEGPAGIKRVLERKGLVQNEHFTYVKSPKPKITIIETGVKIFFEGADGSDVGRGYNLASLWADEIAKWTDPYGAWYEGILPSLRADLPGDHPRAFVTTTPKPIVLLKEWLASTDGSVLTVRGNTFENILNLSPQSVDMLRRKYEGTSMGRQELFGEMLDKGEGILFTYAGIEEHRREADREGITFTVVGVDPGLTGDDDGDECGIVVVGKDADQELYVLEDASMKIAGRDAALYAWKVFIRNKADILVYESNLGKAWMEQVFKDAYNELRDQGLFPEHTSAPLKGVFSTVGKKLRAEPVAMRYEQGHVHHTQRFDALEGQMLTFDPLAPNAKHNSPDRLDALVHACRHLMEVEKRQARIITAVDHSLGYEWDPYGR